MAKDTIKHRRTFTTAQKGKLVAEWEQNRAEAQRIHKIGWAQFNRWKKELGNGLGNEPDNGDSSGDSYSVSVAISPNPISLNEAILALEVKRDHLNEMIEELKRLAGAGR